MRQAANESYGVREQHFALRGQNHGANCGIECGEHARRSQYSGLRERVEQRRLAGVRIAHQRHSRHWGRFAPLPLLRPDAAHVFQLLLHVANAASNLPAIGLKLGFARTARADAAAELRHFHPAAREPRQHVLQLRQFYL